MADLSILYWIAGLVVLLLLDRFVLRRGRIALNELTGDGFVKRENTKRPQHTDWFYRLHIVFTAYPPLVFSKVTYTLRDKERPTTVITGKDRTLDFSAKGNNQEFLWIKADMLSTGPWIADVRVESMGCRYNPFYKIFPMTSHLRCELSVELPQDSTHG